MKRRVAIVICCIAAGVLAIAPFVKSRRPEDPFVLPPADLILSIEAKLHRCNYFLSFEDTPSFNIPGQYIETILMVCVPGKPYDFPDLWMDNCLGSLDIKTNENSFTIHFVGTGKGPLCYEVNGRRYEREGAYCPVKGDQWLDEALQLASILNQIYEETRTGKRSATLEKNQDDLYRSIGRMSPR